MSYYPEAKKGRKPPPVCKAILLCDRVEWDDRSHKTNIKGVFTTFLLPSLPSFTPPRSVYLLLTDAHGQYTIRVEIHDLSDGSIAYSSPARRWGVAGEIISSEMHLPVPSVYFTHSGQYDLVVFANDDEIDRVKFRVMTPNEHARAQKQKDET
jgi:hypothetical protein